MRLNGKDIIDSYEAWGVEQESGDGVKRIVEQDDEGRPGHGAITAEEAAHNYARAFGGIVKHATCFYTEWENA